MARDDFRLLHAERVRWGEADMQGVVFNAHYLTYVDVGVTEYFRALAADQGDIPVGGGDFFMVRTELDFHASAEFDDVIDIGVRIVRFGSSSVEWCAEIHRGDSHLITARMIYVRADVDSRGKQPVPEIFKQQVAAFERLRPEGV